MKKYLLALIGIIVVGALIGYFIYNKPHKDIAKSTPDYMMTSQSLFAAFEENEALANEKYLDKVMQISGTVTESGTDEEGLTSVTLAGGNMMFGVICKLDPLAEHKRKAFSEGEKITLKGVCSGMLMDVVLVRCVEV